jgi:hypothetical protein
MSKDDMEKQGAHVDFKARSRKLLEDAFTVAEEMYKQAVLLAQEKDKNGKPVDIRSNDKRPGLATLQHCAEKSISEIVRLMPLAGVEMTKDKSSDAVGLEGIGFKLPGYDDSIADS